MQRMAISSMLLAAFVLLSSKAFAIGEFPGALQYALQLDYAPPCSVCHESGLAGIGTVSTPFGVNLRLRGLNANDAQSIYKAVEELRRDGTDSDGDGVPDVPELQAGTDPNRYGSDPLLAQQEPGFGCNSSASTPDRPWVAAILLAIGILVLPAELKRSGRRRAARR